VVPRGFRGGVYLGGGGLLACGARIHSRCKLYLEDRFGSLLRFHEGAKLSPVGDKPCFVLL
jgi:hypothetical protein